MRTSQYISKKKQSWLECIPLSTNSIHKLTQNLLKHKPKISHTPKRSLQHRSDVDQLRMHRIKRRTPSATGTAAILKSEHGTPLCPAHAYTHTANEESRSSEEE
ncbi:hypothetical protein QE152_g36238 [Popillia japonica]|uniref:Uncharacterized protein n=1 Tax=Popillia japonica TaxID=7064 RepID=A0AAW1IDD2_POPJA